MISKFNPYLYRSQFHAGWLNYLELQTKSSKLTANHIRLYKKCMCFQWHKLNYHTNIKHMLSYHRLSKQIRMHNKIMGITCYFKNPQSNDFMLVNCWMPQGSSYLANPTWDVNTNLVFNGKSYLSCRFFPEKNLPKGILIIPYHPSHIVLYLIGTWFWNASQYFTTLDFLRNKQFLCYFTTVHLSGDEKSSLPKCFPTQRQQVIKGFNADDLASRCSFFYKTQRKSVVKRRSSWWQDFPGKMFSPFWLRHQTLINRIFSPCNPTKKDVFIQKTYKK